MSTSMFIPAENSPLYDPNTPQHNWYELATTPDRPPIAFSPDTLNDITELRFIHELPQRQTQIYGEDFRVSTRLNVQPETNPILVKLQQTYFESSLYPDRDYTATTGVITKSINSCCCTSSHRNGTCAANHDDNDQPLEQSNPLCFSEVTTKNIRTRTATTAKKFTTNTSSITIGNRTTTQIPSNKTSTTNLGNNEIIRHGNTTTKNHTNHLNTAPTTTTTTTTTTIYDDNEDDIFLFDVDDVVFRTTQIPEKIHHNTEDDVNIIHNVTSDAEPAADDEPDMVIDNDDDEVDNDDDYVNDDDDDDTHNNPTNDIVKTINCFNATIDTYDTLDAKLDAHKWSETIPKIPLNLNVGLLNKSHIAALNPYGVYADQFLPENIPANIQIPTPTTRPHITLTVTTPSTICRDCFAIQCNCKFLAKHNNILNYFL